MKRLIALILSCKDEFVAHQKRVLRSFRNAMRSWWSGHWFRKVVDLAAAFLIARFLVPVALGLAAANFMDGSNTLYATISLTIWFVILEIAAMWLMELIVVLAMFQVAQVTIRVGQHYNRRMKEKHASTSTRESVAG